VTTRRRRGLASRRALSRRGAPIPDAPLQASVGRRWPALIFVVLAVLDLAWYIVDSGVFVNPSPGDLLVHLLRVTPGLTAILLPAALIARQPDVGRRIPSLLVGAILFAAVQGLILAAGPLQPVFATLTPAPDNLPSVVPSEAVYELIVALVSAAGLGLFGFGLLRARRFADQGPPGLAVLVPAAAILATVAGVVGLSQLDLTGVSVTPGVLLYVVASVVLGIVRVVAWAFLAAVAIRGWRAGEAPVAGWWLLVLGTSLVLLALAMLNIRNLIDVTDETVDEVYGYIEATAYAAGNLCFLIAVAVGVPEIDRSEDGEPA
jgi:hypothetical protein